MFAKRSQNIAEKNIFYVRWGGIPNWDPKNETLKKAKTWGMGSGGSCLSSLHENKIREIVSLAVDKHNGPIIENQIKKWLIHHSNLDIHSQDMQNVTAAIVQYELKRLHHLAKHETIPDFSPPQAWSKELKKLAETVILDMPALIDHKPELMHGTNIRSLNEAIIKYQIAKQRKNKAVKADSWSPPQDWKPIMRDLAAEANIGVNRMLTKMEEAGILPLFYTEDEHQQFYYEYCNKRLWPLFHRHLRSNPEQKEETPKVSDIFEVASCNKQAFDEYRKLSFEAAKAVAHKADDQALVWLHDYHLFLMPHFLRRMRPDLRLGYHFHTPIPDGKLIHPLDEDIKRLFSSVMQCNYLSFNTQRDLDNFKAIVTSMGLSTDHVIFEKNPIGVEPVETLEKNLQPKIQSTIEEIISLREKHPDSSFQVVFSVDRIEPSKGLKTRLKAIRDLLESPDPDAKNLLFVMVGPDSRTGIKAYDQLNKWYKEEIQNLNQLAQQKISRDIIKFHGEMAQAELQALGQHADSFMVTSDADGLHLGPVEWLATRNYHDKDRPANIIISKGAGVSEYFPHAMEFNPGDHKQLTSLLRQTTRESSNDKKTRSEAIKRDFHQGEAQGFRLNTWQEKAAKALAKKDESIEQRKNFG